MAPVAIRAVSSPQLLLPRRLPPVAAPGGCPEPRSTVLRPLEAGEHRRPRAARTAASLLPREWSPRGGGAHGALSGRVCLTRLCHWLSAVWAAAGEDRGATATAWSLSLIWKLQPGGTAHASSLGTETSTESLSTSRFPRSLAPPACETRRAHLGLSGNHRPGRRLRPGHTSCTHRHRQRTLSRMTR